MMFSVHFWVADVKDCQGKENCLCLRRNYPKTLTPPKKKKKKKRGPYSELQIISLLLVVSFKSKTPPLDVVRIRQRENKNFSDYHPPWSQLGTIAAGFRYSRFPLHPA
jgi:hypothetical protein